MEVKSTFATLNENLEVSAITHHNRYLIVEDDYALQPIWEHIILAADPTAKLRWARSEEAAEKLIMDLQKSRSLFDFIIADIFLSGEKNGIDLWHFCKNSGIQFLFTSGLSEHRFAELVNKHQIDFPLYIRKPLEISEGIEVLKKILEFQGYKASGSEVN